MTRLLQLLEESPSTQAALNRSLGNVRQLALEPTHEDMDIVGQAAAKRPHFESQTTISVKKVQRVNICHTDCACKCHVLRKIGSRGIFSHLFGRGYIQTAGPAIFGTQCDFKSCRAHTSPRISVEYRLPQWLASRMILMWLTSSPSCSPELLLRIPRVLKWNSVVTNAVERESPKLLKIAIARGDCRPDDVNEIGESLFSVRVDSMSSNYKCIG